MYRLRHLPDRSRAGQGLFPLQGKEHYKEHCFIRNTLCALHAECKTRHAVYAYLSRSKTPTAASNGLLNVIVLSAVTICSRRPRPWLSCAVDTAFITNASQSTPRVRIVARYVARPSRTWRPRFGIWTAPYKYNPCQQSFRMRKL